MSDQLFGPYITGDDIERAVEETLVTWMPEYLRWIERQEGLPANSLPDIRSYVRSPDIDRWPEEQLPSILIVCPGLAGRPTRDGDGTYRGIWEFGIAVVVGARDRNDLTSLVRYYGVAARNTLLQHPDLGGLAEAIDWIDESTDDVPTDPARKRQTMAVSAVFNTEVRNLATTRHVPRVPREDPTPPYPDPPTATTVTVTVEPDPL